MLTPDDVHFGRADRVLDQRRAVLAAAYAAHPERFVQRAPTAREVPTEVWINRPELVATATEQQQDICLQEVQ